MLFESSGRSECGVDVAKAQVSLMSRYERTSGQYTPRLVFQYVRSSGKLFLLSESGLR